MKLSHMFRASLLGIALAQSNDTSSPSLTDVLSENNSTLSVLSGTIPSPNHTRKPN